VQEVAGAGVLHGLEQVRVVRAEGVPRHLQRVQDRQGAAHEHEQRATHGVQNSELEA